jgi:hypothetical protein
MTDVSSYAESKHKTHWIFSAERIAELRQKAHESGKYNEEGSSSSSTSKALHSLTMHPVCDMFSFRDGKESLHPSMKV